MASLALVTGASGGIGLEFAKQLAQAGYDLALVARSKDKLEALAADLRAKHGINVEVVPCDLARPDAAHQIQAQIPECDVLVNNAGFANNGKFGVLPAAQTLEELQVDVVALTQLTKLYLPGMLERKNGKILNVASTAGFLPGPNMAVYYASKAGITNKFVAISPKITPRAMLLRISAKAVERSI